MRHLFVLAAAALVAPACLAAPAEARTAVLPPLERPAVMLRDTQRAALLGLARAGGRVVAVGERGVVLLSDDGGRQWRQAAAVPVSVTLTAVQFVDAQVGWAVGHQGVVLHSTDGGEHWSRQLEGRALAELLLQDARALGDERAVAEAGRAVQEGADKPLLTLHFIDKQRGWVAGAFNTLLQTEDGGRTWQARSSRLPNPKGSHLYALSLRGRDLLLAGEQGLLMHSPDGGQRFERVTTPYAGSFFGVAREADGAWLLAGLRGNVLRSTDAGKTWVALSEGAPVSVTAMLDSSTGTPLLANQAGQLWTPEQGTARLHLVATTPARQPGSLLRLEDGSLLIAGWNGITRVSPESR
jgi:photosystem II stability/assembly factor-like uncharacterized protein